MFVSFEGIDGSGKSTQAGLLARRLGSEGREVVWTREPGGTALGEPHPVALARRGRGGAGAEAALFAAARAQLVSEVIRPALARGAFVICDRFLDSSLAYQGIARGLGLDAVLALNRACGGRHASRSDALARARRRRWWTPGSVAVAIASSVKVPRSAPRSRRHTGISQSRFADRVVAIDATQSEERIGERVYALVRERSGPA